MGKVATAAKYQMLPDLSEEEYLALKADIAGRGVLVAVEKDEDGNVLDGHHRERIAEELGIRYPVVVRRGLTEAQKREHALKMNMARRQLTPVGWGRAFGLLLEERGVKLGQGARNDRTSDTVSEVAAELGVVERTARRRMRMAASYDGLPRDLREKVDAGLPLRKAERQAGRRRREQERRRLAATVAGLPAEVRAGDFRKVLDDVADASVDLIFTDPPYDRASLPLYGDVAALAVRVLRPGGSLVAYLPSAYLGPALDLARPHLPLHALLAVPMGGDCTQLQALRVMATVKHLGWFVKGRYAGEWLMNFIPGGAAEKHLHDWQQGEAEADYVVNKMTRPGGLVVDPMCGSGTALAAALKLGRRALGCEIDPATAGVAAARLWDVGKASNAKGLSVQ